MTKEDVLELKSLFIEKLKAKEYSLYEYPKLSGMNLPLAYSFFNGENKVATFAHEPEDLLSLSDDCGINLHFGTLDTALIFNKDLALIIINQFIN